MMLTPPIKAVSQSLGKEQLVTYIVLLCEDAHGSCTGQRVSGRVGELTGKAGRKRQSRGSRCLVRAALR